MNIFIQQCRRVVGDQHVLTDPEDMLPYLQDWKRQHTGAACAVVRPGTTEEVAAIISLCAQFEVPVVPQGGNTGLVLGSVPDSTGVSIVLSLKRMNRVRAIDTANNTATVEAGCILQTIQETAASNDRLFPLALAAQGSCTIGGNLATNAGGNSVLRYGTMRELCLGLEVVTASGEIWHGLRGLRKDNSGYDLRDLLIGSEGTLGVITAAVLKLYPKPRAQITAFASLRSVAHAMALLDIFQRECGSILTAFELMSGACLDLVKHHFPQLTMPLQESGGHGAPYYVLVELSDSETEEHAIALMENSFNLALEAELAQDVAIASSMAQSAAIWSIREHVPMAQAQEGSFEKHDISVPVSEVVGFIAAAKQALTEQIPDCSLFVFGHAGDGNLHFNVRPGAGLTREAEERQRGAINSLVYDMLKDFAGSISAEHGIGAQKIDELWGSKSDVEHAMMRAVKQALDPRNILNPGKLLRQSAGRTIKIMKPLRPMD